MNEDVKVVCEVKDKIMDLLHKANREQDFSVGDISFLYQAIKAVKDACEVKEMLEDEGDGYSSANRGQHYVRGHYSRDSGMIRNGDSRNGYSSRRDSRGRYSRDDGRSEMMEHLEMALDSATEQDRDAIRRMIQKLENA